MGKARQEKWDWEQRGNTGFGLRSLRSGNWDWLGEESSTGMRTPGWGRDRTETRTREKGSSLGGLERRVHAH